MVKKFYELYQERYKKEADNESIGFWRSFKEKINGFREMIEVFKKSKSIAKEEADKHVNNLSKR